MLLISSAKSKNIDISVWLTEDGSDGKVAVPDFNSKLISLGLIVGMGESSVKKSKLDYATSDTSLGRILIICRAGKDSNGVALIDVSKFLKTCNRMLTSSINDSIVTSLSDYNLSDSVEMDIAGTFSLVSSRLFCFLSIRVIVSLCIKYPDIPESHKNVCRDEWNAVHGIDNEENVDINVSFGTSDVIREGDVPQILSERLKSQRSYKYASSTPFNTENEYRGGKIGFEKANISDRYSDSCFLELKHANQWKLGNSGSTTERTMDELYSEENEIENYDGNNLDDDYIIDTASTSVKSAYASQIEDQAFQSLHPKETPLDNCMLRQSSGKIRKFSIAKRHLLRRINCAEIRRRDPSLTSI